MTLFAIIVVNKAICLENVLKNQEIEEEEEEAEVVEVEVQQDKFHVIIVEKKVISQVDVQTVTLENKYKKKRKIQDKVIKNSLMMLKSSKHIKIRMNYDQTNQFYILV